MWLLLLYARFFFKKKRVYFYRDYLQFQGGHLKVWDYFNHIDSFPDYKASISFSDRSVFDQSNPWYKNKKIRSNWDPANADILFLAGLDWDSVLPNKAYRNRSKLIPIINLIQGLSHSDPKDHKYQFLSEPAIRICVSPEVAESLESTGKVNGPIFTIPNGIDLRYLNADGGKVKKIDFLIVAIKNQKLGSMIKEKLIKLSSSVVLVDQRILRQDFIELLKQAKTVICLPLAHEGFYLPALEAMAADCLVICPDCIGNRSFCKNGETCFVPDYNLNSILDVAMRSASLDIDIKKEILNNARSKALEHDLTKEREQFMMILKNVYQLYPT